MVDGSAALAYPPFRMTNKFPSQKYPTASAFVAGYVSAMTAALRLITDWRSLSDESDVVGEADAAGDGGVSGCPSESGVVCMTIR